MPVVGKKAEKKRRPKGTGSISVLPDGRADAELKVKSWDGSERRERKRLASEEEAEKWLLKVRHEVATDTLLSAEAGRLTVSDYLDAWLRDSVAGTVARHTQRDYEDKVRLHLKPALGKVRLADIVDGGGPRYRDGLPRGHGDGQEGGHVPALRA